MRPGGPGGREDTVLEDIQPGLAATLERLVEERYCTRRGQYQIFSTPDLVLLLEETAIEALAPCLGAHQSSVGSRVDIAHLAPTLLGQRVRCTATVTEVDRRRVVFAIEARDDTEVIATGSHERFVVDLEKFSKRLADKAAAAGH
jgi:predicted thioesterase